MPNDNESSHTPQRLPYKLPPPDPQLTTTRDDGKLVNVTFMIGVAAIASLVMLVKIIAMIR
jgi:hypothetical protein